MTQIPSDLRPSVLILGANGRLGAATAHSFDAAGWRVLAQVRREPSPDLPSTVTVVRERLTSASEIAAHAHGAHVVVHAVNPIYTRWDEEAMPALLAGLAVAEQLGAHFMLPGNVYSFGESMPPVLREDTPIRPSTRKGQIRADMEALIANRAASGGFTASVVRAGDFYGAGRGSYLDLVIVKSLRDGKLVYPGPLRPTHAWAYLPDLARAFVRVAMIERPAPFDVWHFEGHTCDGKAFLDAVEAAVVELGLAPKQPLRRAELPWGLIRAAGLVLPMWRELARMSYLWRVPHAMEGRRLSALEGPGTIATPMRDALRESIRELFAAGRRPQ